MDIPTLKTSVRNLVEFVLRRGDLPLGGFQMRNRAAAGSRAHRRIQKSRPDGYEAEVSIAHRVEEPDLHLEIYGRIDGIFAAEQPVIIEEIKSTTQPLALLHKDFNPLHWAQAKCYAFMYALQHNLPKIRVQLTYTQLDTRQEKCFYQDYTLAQLESFISGLVEAYLRWARLVLAWQATRNQSIRQFGFPYTGYRPGQRKMAVAVYNTIRQQGQLFVQAPTGIGKTIAALFPAVKAVGMGLTEKIFYLTAKTPGRTVAEKAIEDMRQAGLCFKSLTLTAKEKICFCNAEGIDPEQCEFTKNYYDKLNQALEDAFQHEAFSREAIIALARRHNLCPFEFSLDLALWVDCIICDYNYAFDPRVYLRRFFDFGTAPFVFLVDEAHNLPDRARSMFSAGLDKQTVLELRRTLKPHLPGLAKRLSALNQVLLEKRKQCQAENRQALVEQELPQPLVSAVADFCRDAEVWLAQNQKTAFWAELLEFYFQCHTFLRTADFYDVFYVTCFERRGKSDVRARLFCIDPAPLLATALERGQSAIFFSATLLPIDYFEQLIVGLGDTPKLLLPSPFPRENLGLLIHNKIATRYVVRENSYQPIAGAIGAICNAHPGNYLIFFPSYAYLLAVLEQFQTQFPEQQILVQERGMSEELRDEFLAQFSAANSGTMVGFAVMGGIFGEGIDLVGKRLVGAIIVGVGLPQMGFERNLIKDYFAAQNKRGFEYAYQYPGLNRVMQAAGRVIRTETDRGIIVLLDERFAQHRYRRLYPPEWQGAKIVQHNNALKAQLTRFWHSPDPEGEV